MFSAAKGGFNTAAAGGDPYWNNVKVYLTGENLSDTSSSPHTVTNFSVTTSTTQVKYGTSSLYFNGTSARLVVSGSDIAAGSGDFTVDFWGYLINRTTDRCHIDTRTGPTTNNAMIYFSDTRGGLSDYVHTGYYVFNNVGSTFSLNAWHHMALSRSAGVNRVFMDGTLIASQADTVNYSVSGLTVGSVIGGGAYYYGWMDNFRLTPGIARYTGNFTPPTASEYGPP
jgi:hypothetical protein